MKLRYVFRRPSYPVVCEVPGDAVCAHTLQQLERKLRMINISNVENLPLVDAQGDRWEVHVSQQVIIPAFESRRWTKDELLRLYKQSKVGQINGLPIPETVAKRKRVSELILLIVEWLSTGPSGPKGRRTEDEHSAVELQVTAKQGQYLSFIYYYTKIHGVAPPEAEMQRYFGVSAASVRQMISTLESKGLIERTPGKASSIRLLVPRDSIPDLE